MAIRQILSNSNPMVHTEVSCKLEGLNTIKLPSAPPSVNFCHCDFECEYEEKVFANPDGEDYQNDQTYLIDEVVDDTGGTILFQLFKDNKLLTDIVDDTLGRYYPLGSIENTETAVHATKSGLRIDWKNVYNIYGIGQYYIKVTVSNFGQDFEYQTVKYNLKFFNTRQANNTFVLRVVQNGYILNGLDLSGLNWNFQHRISGKLITDTPTFEKTPFLNSDYVEKQNQAQTIENYKLHCDFIPSAISQPIIKNYSLANDIFVTDYNIWNNQHLQYNEIGLVFEGFEEVETFDKSRNGNYILNMKEKRQDTLKRNVR